jgi:sugar lactone lactonase YvrE
MNANALVVMLSAMAAYGSDKPWTEQYASEAAAMNKACIAKDYATCRGHLLNLEKLLDGRADIEYRLAKVEANLGHQDAAIEKLALFSKCGLTFADPAAEPVFAELKKIPEFDKVVARVHAARQPISRSTTFLTLVQPDLIAEDIAFDPAADKFYVSSVRRRKIISIDRTGKISEFVPKGQPDVWAILALGVDVKRRILWAATAAMPESIGYRKEDEGRSALLKYSLDSGALLKRYDLDRDSPHALGDMTVSKAGDVYVSDGHGIVYWLDHNKNALEVLIGKGTFSSPQTPALSADERKLFVPDYTRGISIVDLSTRQVKLMEHPSELSLGGIDGMYLTERTLFAIQNGTAPERVIRMTLDASFTRVTDWETIEANWPGLGDPTHGVVVGDTFYFIANSGWDRMADDGSVKSGATFEPATIRRLPISLRK